jgi:multicomponent Na+:H+ antiporter subunit F
MTWISPTNFGLLVETVLITLGFALVLTFMRLVRGPTLPDRVIALDLIGIITVGIISVFAIETNQPVFLIVAMVLALIAFIGTMAFAYFIAKGGAP